MKRDRRITDSQGRPVCDLEWEAFGGYDEGAFVISANYLDCPKWFHRIYARITGKLCKCPTPVPDDELEHLTDSYPEMGDEHVLDSAIGAADAYYEGER